MENEITQKRAKLTIIGLCIVTLILFAIRIYAANTLDTKGGELGELQDQVKVVSLQNDLLRQQIIQEESFRVIATKAAQMGFVPTTDKDYIYLH